MSEWRRGYDAYWEYPELSLNLNASKSFRMGWWAAYDDDHDWGGSYAW